MRKLALRIDELDVQSFQTTAAAPHRGGTVQAFQQGDTIDVGCTDACSLANTCAGYESCDATCDTGTGEDLDRRIILYDS